MVELRLERDLKWDGFIFGRHDEDWCLLTFLEWLCKIGACYWLVVKDYGRQVILVECES